MQRPPTIDGLRTSHKTVQFLQFSDDFEAPFDDDDEDEYPVSLFSLAPFPLTDEPKFLKSCDSLAIRNWESPATTSREIIAKPMESIKRSRDDWCRKKT